MKALFVFVAGGAGACAQVRIADGAIYDPQCGVRAEDHVEQLEIDRLGFGKGVSERIQFANGQPGPGFAVKGGHDAPALAALLETGFPPRPAR